MAAVLGRAFQKGMTGGSGFQDEAVYFDTPRRGLLHSSFAMFLIVVIVLNSVAIAGGIMSQVEFHNSSNCNRNSQNPFYYMDGWFLANAMFGVIHILAALYLVRKIEEPLYPEDPSHRVFVAAEMIGAAPGVDYRRTPAYNPAIYNHYPTQTVSPKASSLPMHHVSRPPPPGAASTGFSPTEPESWARVKHVICQSHIFAVYIVVFAIYVLWHKFFDVRSYNQAIVFVMKCADIFIVAGPTSFALSVVIALMRRREL